MDNKKVYTSSAKRVDELAEKITQQCHELTKEMIMIRTGLLQDLKRVLNN